MNIRRAPPSGLKEYPDDNFGFAIASLVLGVVDFFLVLIPFIGLVGIGGWIVGIILGINALRSRGKVMAIAGIVLSSLGLIAFITLFILSFRSPPGWL